MEIWKLYLSSVILNFLPIIGIFLLLSMIVGVNNIHGEMTVGFYIYVPFFIAASILNLSFFLLKIKFVRNNKVANCFACYISSLFFLIIAIYLINTSYSSFELKMLIDWDWIMGSLFYSIYFFINVILAFIYRRKFSIINEVEIKEKWRTAPFCASLT